MITVLNSLNQCLETALAKPESLRQTLCQLVEELGNKQNLSRLLQDILLEPAALREVASHSYRHPNGYDKIVLCSTSEIIVPYEARLHIWWSDTERPSTAIHNHGWDFASMVLSGRLECQEYEVGEGGLPMHRCSCSRSAKNIYELKYAGIDEIRPTRKYSILPHSPYFMEATTLHRAAGGAGLTTATILVQGHTHQPSSTNYHDQPFESTNIYSSIVPMEPTVLAGHIAAILPILE